MTWLIRCAKCGKVRKAEFPIIIKSWRTVDGEWKKVPIGSYNKAKLPKDWHTLKIDGREKLHYCNACYRKVKE